MRLQRKKTEAVILSFVPICLPSGVCYESAVCVEKNPCEKAVVAITVYHNIKGAQSVREPLFQWPGCYFCLLISVQLTSLCRLDVIRACYSKLGTFWTGCLTSLINVKNHSRRPRILATLHTQHGIKHGYDLAKHQMVYAVALVGKI